MIVKEFYKNRNDGTSLVKTFSDNGVYIVKLGTDETYIEAIDVDGAPFEYAETNKKIIDEK